MDNGAPAEKTNAKVIHVANLTRNVVESHLRAIFGFYGEITKLDLPIYGKCESKEPLHMRHQTQLYPILSWSKQRQGSTGICRHRCRSESYVSYGRWPTRRRHSQDQIV